MNSFFSIHHKKNNLDHFFTCHADHGCKPERHFLSSCLEVNSTGYSEFNEPISARLQRYPLFNKLTSVFYASVHREHTLLLNRKRVNKGMKRVYSLPLSPVVLTRPHCRESRYLQVLCSTVELNSYLGFSALCKNFICFMYKI